MLQLLDTAALKWLEWRYDSKAKKYANEHPEHGFVLHRAEIGEDGMFVDGTSPAIAFLAAEASKMLKNGNAQNYIQFDMVPHIASELRAIRVTVQYADGKSPAQVNEEFLDALVTLYKKHRVDVAQICDESLDRSGALLGKIREMAMSYKR